MKKIVSLSEYDAIHSLYLEGMVKQINESTEIVLPFPTETSFPNKAKVPICDDLRNFLLTYVQSPEHIVRGSLQPPTPLYTFPEAENIALLSKVENGEDISHIYKHICKMIGLRTRNTIPQPCPSPNGYTMSIVNVYHTDLSNEHLRNGYDMYICTITEDPRITTHYIATPTPSLFFDIDALTDITDTLYDKHLIDDENLKEGLKKFIKTLSHRSHLNLIQLGLLKTDKLEPNTVYRVSDTVHISPPLVKNAGPRLHLPFFYEP